MAGIIPAVLVFTSTDIVVRFLGIADEIAIGLQVVGIVLDAVVGNYITTAHGLGAHGDGIHSRDPCTAHRGTNGGIGVAMHVLEPLFGKSIDMGRVRMRIPIRADPRDIVIFTG